MPTYDYACASCGHQFEAVQHMRDAPLKECPKCGKTVQRVLSGGIGISFQGPGFYITDSQRPVKKPAPKPEAKAPPSPVAKSA
jgi:putative FmdB family regulatory protein